MNKNTLDDIIRVIIENNSGVYTIYWTEEFENLSDEDKKYVKNKVFEEIEDCSSCGWYFDRSEFEYCDDGETRCGNCYNEYEQNY